MDLATLGERQHSVAHVRQLRALGIAAAAVRGRVRDGVWRWLLPGVVALHPGHVTDDARRHAVCLWLPAGVLCGPTAAALHGIKARPTTIVHVAVTAGHPRGPDWVRVHRLRDLPGEHRTYVDGLPTTTAARTVVDVHDAMTGRSDRRAMVTDAVQRHLVGAHAVIRAAVTTPGLVRRSELGATLLAILDGAESAAEIAFAEFCAVWDLPRPSPQHRVRTRLGDVRLDFAPSSPSGWAWRSTASRRTRSTDCAAATSNATWRSPRSAGWWSGSTQGGWWWRLSSSTPTCSASSGRGPPGRRSSRPGPAPP